MDKTKSIYEMILELRREEKKHRVHTGPGILEKSLNFEKSRNFLIILKVLEKSLNVIFV